MPVQVPFPTKTVWASATTLFDVAAQYLGDPTQWDRVARANPQLFNGITEGFMVDPWIGAAVELYIPPIRKVTNGGAFQ